jgi:hypothetical protein
VAEHSRDQRHAEVDEPLAGRFSERVRGEGLDAGLLRRGQELVAEVAERSEELAVDSAGVLRGVGEEEALLVGDDGHLRRPRRSRRWTRR